MKRNRKKAQKKAQRKLRNVQDYVSNIQDYVQPGVQKVSDTLQSGTTLAQAALLENAKKAQKNLKKAQDNLQDLQAAMQENLGSGLAATQDVLSKRSQQASQTWQQIASSAKDTSEDLQDRYASYVQKRKHARALFRWGLVVGVVLALLYSPLTGEEVRRRVSEQFNQIRALLGIY
jgi:gas vesicle protein